MPIQQTAPTGLTADKPEFASLHRELLTALRKDELNVRADIDTAINSMPLVFQEALTAFLQAFVASFFGNMLGTFKVVSDTLYARELAARTQGRIQ